VPLLVSTQQLQNDMKGRQWSLTALFFRSGPGGLAPTIDFCSQIRADRLERSDAVWHKKEQ